MWGKLEFSRSKRVAEIVYVSAQLSIGEILIAKQVLHCSLLFLCIVHETERHYLNGSKVFPWKFAFKSKNVFAIAKNHLCRHSTNINYQLLICISLIWANDQLWANAFEAPNKAVALSLHITCSATILKCPRKSRKICQMKMIGKWWMQS